MKVKFFQALAVAIALLLALPALGKGIAWRGNWKPVKAARSLFIPIIGDIDEADKTLTEIWSNEIPEDKGGSAKVNLLENW